MTTSQASWASRFGLILAMAGNAVGLGNLLRFPVQAARNGGGAFMIPYFVCLLLMGIPLMWLEWSLGRLGGKNGTRHTVGAFAAAWKHWLSPYLGLLGLWIPIGVVSYYVYIASWTFGYAGFSLAGSFPTDATRTTMSQFFDNYLWGDHRWYAYGILVLVVFINWFITRRALSSGIETLAKIGMPVLFAFGFLLSLRVAFLGDPASFGGKAPVSDGFGFIWNPDFSQLTNPSIWLAAAGQIFFTLSIGMGTLHCYAAYLTKKDDVALSGISTVSLNEIAEVIIGGSLAIPLAFAFFGGPETVEIAKAGAFDLGFMSLPLAFNQLPFGHLLGGMWFTLLFIAALTSSVAMSEPAICYLMEVFAIARERAATVVWGFIFLGAQVAVFGPGAIDEIDFWIGTVGLVVFGLFESLVWAYGFGIDRAYAELCEGSLIRVPPVIKVIWKYICPAFLIALLGYWMVTQAPGVLMMNGVKETEIAGRWAARALMVGGFVVMTLSVRRSRYARPEEVAL